MSIELELNEAKISDLLDQDTLDYYAMGRVNEIIEVNRDLFADGEEFMKDEYYFAFTQMKENDIIITFLQPYRVSVGKHSWKYKFGCQDSEGNLFWFFKGKPNNDRQIAFQIFAQLTNYCQNKNLKPFIIKK
jgi:hypothetical protein